MSKAKETKPARSPEEVLRQAREIEKQAYAADREAFIAKYNKLCEQHDLQIAAVPKVVPAGNGIFALGLDYVIERRPKDEGRNGEDRK